MRFHERHRLNGAGRERGLTLLELLVVVAILAVLATVAIRSTSDLGGQVRYDATQNTLNTFRDAVLGPVNQTAPDGTPYVTGFVADMGRPPRSRTTAHSVHGGVPDVYELYSATLPGSLRPYALYTIASANTVTNLLSNITTTSLLYDTSIRVGAGWRGPYITKSTAIETLQDGWGKALVSRPLDLGTSAAEINQWPTMLLAFRTNSTTQPFSLPEDGNYTAVTDAGRDLAGWFTASGFEGAPSSSGDPYAGRFYSVINTNEYQVPITVTVTCNNALFGITGGSTNWVLLTMYGPNPNVATDSSTRPLLCTAQQAAFNAYSTTFSLSGSSAPTIGTRLFKAHLRHTTTNVTSRLVYFPIRPGVQSINISLP
jgi:prepilin-type N-terminal cleavage/methylation domain-containing protein